MTTIGRNDGGNIATIVFLIAAIETKSCRTFCEEVCRRTFALSTNESDRQRNINNKNNLLS